MVFFIGVHALFEAKYAELNKIEIVTGTIAILKEPANMHYGHLGLVEFRKKDDQRYIWVVQRLGCTELNLRGCFLIQLKQQDSPRGLLSESPSSLDVLKIDRLVLPGNLEWYSLIRQFFNQQSSS